MTVKKSELQENLDKRVLGSLTKKHLAIPNESEVSWFPSDREHRVHSRQKLVTSALRIAR